MKRKKAGMGVVMAVKGKEEILEVDLVITVRRRAALQGLGLETVGLDGTEAFIRVDERMQTRSNTPTLPPWGALWRQRTPWAFHDPWTKEL